jgi:hypothetical protein
MPEAPAQRATQLAKRSTAINAELGSALAQPLLNSVQPAVQRGDALLLADGAMRPAFFLKHQELH